MKLDINIEVTDNAVEFLQGLLESVNMQDPKGPKSNIKVAIDNPGTPHAETLLWYCKEIDKGDSEVMPFENFDMYIDRRSIKFLDDAQINYDKDNFSGQLTIRAPNSRVSKLDDDSTLEEKVNYYLYNDVAPMLASHGGNVKLHTITEDNIAVLEFGGGCQGCSAIDITLTHGIEQILLEKVPEIKGIKDMTDHTQSENAYQ